MAEQQSNFGRTTLNGAINDVTTSVTVTDGSVLPSSGDFRLRVESELMLVTARTGNSLTVTRGVEGTSAVSHPDGAAALHVFTAAALGAEIDERIATHAGGADPHSPYLLIDGTRAMTGDLDMGTNIIDDIGAGVGGLTDYDINIGDTTTPDYGIARLGDSIIGRTSSKPPGVAYNLDGAFVIRNDGGPITGDIEFAILDSSDLVRFALAKSGIGNATYNPRSMIIAGPAVADSDEVTLAYWQTQGIFHNLVMDTGTYGADVGIQNDLEVEGDIFTDSIKESTPAAGITLTGQLIGPTDPTAGTHVGDRDFNDGRYHLNTVDHGGIGGLGDDDHAQYLLASGARDLTGTWDVSQTIDLADGGLTLPQADIPNPQLSAGVVVAELDTGAVDHIEVGIDGSSPNKRIAWTEEVPPIDHDYLVATAHPNLTGEIVVGATPGGELGGTWASPTVDATHSGSAHHSQSHALGGGDHTGTLTLAGEVTGAHSSNAVAATHSGSAHSNIPTQTGALNMGDNDIAAAKSIGLSAAGTGAEEGLHFTGDTNTGIYSPAAETIIVQANNATRITVDTQVTIGGNLAMGGNDISGVGSITGSGVPSGELGGTWSSITVDATHSGSSHANIPTQTGSLNMGNQTLHSPLDPTAGTHVGDRDYNDARYVQPGDAMTGELGGTFSAATVDTTHSGSAHSNIPTQTAALNMGGFNISSVGNVYGATTVEARYLDGPAGVDMRINAGTWLYLESAGTIMLRMDSAGNFSPQTSGQNSDLGSGSLRWHAGYFKDEITVEEDSGAEGRVKLRTGTQVVNGTALGYYYFGGQDNNPATYDSAYIYARGKGTWATGSHPTEIVMVTRTSADVANAWYFQQDGGTSFPGSVGLQGTLDMNTNPIVETTHITPAATDLYDIGSPTLRYDHMYLIQDLDIGPGTTATNDIDVDLHTRSNAAKSEIDMQRSRESVGADAAVSDNDELGEIYSRGHDGTDMHEGAAILFRVEGAVSNNVMPTEMVFKTNTGGSDTTEHWRVSRWGDFDTRFATTDRAVYAKAPVVNTYTGNSTWTKPNGTTAPMPAYLVIEVVGGGGGGGGSASTGSGQHAAAAGGGGGGYSRKLIDPSTLSSNITVTVGSGGNGGAAGANDGSSGNTSSCAATGMTTVAGNGGGGGQAGVASSGNNIRTGGVGGTASGGDINAHGMSGTNSGVAGSDRFIIGHGGSSGGGWGGGQRGSLTSGFVGQGEGSGGSGSSNAASAGSKAGGDGEAGYVIITEFYA